MNRLPNGWWVVALVVGASSCFGNSIVRRDPVTLIENLGGNRYLYHSTRLRTEAARGAASVALGIPPADAREIGLIEVTAEYGGFGPDGLRDSEADFYPTLATIAGAMGGTHFMVLRSTREPRAANCFTSLTVDVLAAPSTP
jgi:hypothetical protein